jgi:hypothetical protein
MKAKIIGISDSLSHFSLSQQIEFDIKHLEHKMHELFIDGKKHIIEISETFFVNKNTVIIKGYISDNVNVGKIGIEITF